MNTAAIVRFLWILLCAAFLAVYIASKIDFFTHYAPLGIGDFLRSHRVYWIAMAAIALSIWLVDRFRRDRP